MTRQTRILAPALLAAALAAGADDGSPAWMERWLFNAQERTQRAMEAMEQGEAAAALEPLDTALRLAGDSAEAVYNVGTARLEAGAGDAQGLLQTAAELGEGPIVPSAHYNLGNARLAAEDFPAAIDAYKQALRLDPGFADAKFNLELAQRLLEEEEQQQDQEQEDQQQEDQQDQQQEEQQDQQQEEQEQPQERHGEPGEEPREPQPQEQGESPLPQFRDLPDMTAEEAAAILEAVENMERERRRQEALERARVNVQGKKDW